MHVTLDLGGQMRFGPDVQWMPMTALGTKTTGSTRRAPQPFAEAIRALLAGAARRALLPAYAGIRPKISGPGEAAADFLIQGPADHGVAGLVNLFGIESPGLTSCLAIGEWVAGMLRDPQVRAAAVPA